MTVQSRQLKTNKTIRWELERFFILVFLLLLIFFISFFFLRHYICVVFLFSHVEDGSRHRFSCLVLLVIKVAVNT